MSPGRSDGPEVPVTRVVTLCVFSNGSRILVGRGVDRVKEEEFFRPVGGAVEPGETAAEALRREMREELGAEISDIVRLGVVESLFTFEGRPGHEVVVIHDARFVDSTLYEADILPLLEDAWGGEAIWLDLHEPLPGPLYPDGLASLLALPDGAVPSKSVRVTEYDSTWPRRFEKEHDELVRLLGSACSAIHHVGSSSVPALAAKPVIDILIETADLSLVDERTAAMERRGYIARGEYGIPGRRYFSRPAGDTTPKVHLHVFEEGHERAVLLLRFRDHLRAHPVEAQLYGALKTKLAERHPDDRDAYQEAKAPFIEALLDRISS